MEFGNIEMGCRFTLHLDSKLVYIKISSTEAVIDNPGYTFGLKLSSTTLVHIK